MEEHINYKMGKLKIRLDKHQRRNKQGWGHKIEPGMTLKMQMVMTRVMGEP